MLRVLDVCKYNAEYYDFENHNGCFSGYDYTTDVTEHLKREHPHYVIEYLPDELKKCGADIVAMLQAALPLRNIKLTREFYAHNAEEPVTYEDFIKEDTHKEGVRYSRQEKDIFYYIKCADFEFTLNNYGDTWDPVSRQKIYDEIFREEEDYKYLIFSKGNFFEFSSEKKPASNIWDGYISLKNIRVPNPARKIATIRDMLQRHAYWDFGVCLAVAKLLFTEETDPQGLYATITPIAGVTPLYTTVFAQMPVYVYSEADKPED
jgi:hypothetical protein